MRYRGTRTMGVFFRGPIAWIRYSDRNGKERKESTRQTSVAFAKDLLRRRKLETAEERYFPERASRRRTFQELFDRWWIDHGQKTRSHFVYLKKRILDRFGTERACEIQPDDVREFLGDLKAEGLGASSVNHHRTLMNSVFNHTIKWKFFYGDNPVKAVPQEKEPPGRDRVLDRDELRRLLHACEKAGDEELRTFVLIGLLTTLRKGEILKRRWTDVDVTGELPSLHVPVTKNGRPMTVPLHDVLLEALKRLPSLGSRDYLFPSRPTARFPDPKKPYMWDIGKRFRAACVEAKIKGLRIHDLRHCGPSILLARGVPDGIVRKLTGHRSKELERYQHLSKEVKKRTVDLIAEELFGPEQNPEQLSGDKSCGNGKAV